MIRFYTMKIPEVFYKIKPIGVDEEAHVVRVKIFAVIVQKGL